MGSIQEHNKSVGLFWFSPDTLRFFKGRVCEDVFQGPGGVYFVSSERREWNTPRLYTVRNYNPGINTWGTFQGYRTAAQAKGAAKRAAAGDATAPSAPVQG
jgi:hypothetical protein